MGGGGDVHKHRRADTQTHEQNATRKQRLCVYGRLLSEFLVQLILVSESGRGYKCGHVDWSDG